MVGIRHPARSAATADGRGQLACIDLDQAGVGRHGVTSDPRSVGSTSTARRSLVWDAA
jgi:hypothetical protein